ncbi:TPA: flagellar basal body rod protein FlgC [Salmonella enterica]|uniref:Flagellar basal-body rod protein FlgC n=1 Tax=Salmonella enterica TaxID=28901 RepID=A0A757C515_SALER|nr:flagellar basal body rod protein FlgC [Salmonella enterica subsp. enterica serovar Richmond]HAG0390747.1 flagellar basal body rod protein FlgC [Salmonella enterica]
MSLLSIFDISGSALVAQSKRLNISASNMANADSIAGPDGEPYHARQAIFNVDDPTGQGIGGVIVSNIVEKNTPDRLVYEPTNPFADNKGYIHMPDIDVVAEMVNTISASRSYQANIEVMNTAKTMVLKTLTLGQ